MQPSLLGWSNMLADIGGFWVDRHSRRFAMGLNTVHRSGIRRSGAREQRSGVGITPGSAFFVGSAETKHWRRQCHPEDLSLGHICLQWNLQTRRLDNAQVPLICHQWISVETSIGSTHLHVSQVTKHQGCTFGRTAMLSRGTKYYPSLPPLRIRKSSLREIRIRSWQRNQLR